jgi:peptidoglycan/LPS O-acetylase OafA/YrhL
MQQSNENRLSYIPSLDGIRAFSITSVILYHSFPNYFPGGWIGVDVFFVLSGYLITTILQKDIVNFRKNAIKMFYISRILRILPPFFLMIALLLPISLLAGIGIGTYVRSSIVAGMFVMNWNRAFDIWPQSLVAHSWSLAIEEQFYIIWPVVLIFLRSRNSRRWAIAAILTVVIWRCFLVLNGESFERTYNGFDTHVDGLLIGGAMALAPLSLGTQKIIGSFAIIYIILLICIMLSLPLYSIPAQTFGFTAASILGASIIISAQHSPSLSKIMSNRVVVYLGKISYSLYLWHYPFLIVFLNNVSQKYAMLYIVPATAFAMISFHLVEQPISRFKKSILYTPTSVNDQ